MLMHAALAPLRDYHRTNMVAHVASKENAIVAQ